MKILNLINKRAKQAGIMLIYYMLLTSLPVRADPTIKSDEETSQNALAQLLNHESISWLRVEPADRCSDRTLIAIKQGSARQLLCYFAGDSSGCRPLLAHHKKDVLCGNRGWSSPRPAWLDSLIALVAARQLQVAPFSEGSGLLVVERHLSADEPYAVLQLNGAWRVLDDLRETDTPSELEVFSEGLWRLLDVSHVTGQPLYALFTARYSPGSQAGSTESGLLLLATTADGPPKVVLRKRIGIFGWSIGPQERHRLIRLGVYQFLRARPHYELQLEPVFRRGMIELQPKRAALAGLSRWCQKSELPSKRSEPGSLCPIAVLEELRALAGAWRFSASGLQRAGVRQAAGSAIRF